MPSLLDDRFREWEGVQESGVGCPVWFSTEMGPLLNFTYCSVNAGEKMQRRVGVKMHHGGMPEGPPREDFYFGLKPGVGCRSAQLLVAGADVACSASADSCRRSFRGCGRGGSAGRVAHRSTARSRRPHDASFFERVVRRTCVLNSTICMFERLICQGIPLVIWWPDNRPL